MNDLPDAPPGWNWNVWAAHDRLGYRCAYVGLRPEGWRSWFGPTRYVVKKPVASQNDMKLLIRICAIEAAEACRKDQELIKHVRDINSAQ